MKRAYLDGRKFHMVQIPDNSWYAEVAMKLAGDLPEKFRNPDLPALEPGDRVVGDVPESLRSMLNTAMFLKDRAHAKMNRQGLLIAQARVSNEDPNEAVLENLEKESAWDSFQSEALTNLFWTELKYALNLRHAPSIAIRANYQVVVNEMRSSLLEQLFDFANRG